LSEEVFGETFACGKPCCDEELCIGQASSVVAMALAVVRAALAGVDAAFALGLEECAAIGNAADVTA
jgi:hypothetical protein